MTRIFHSYYMIELSVVNWFLDTVFALSYLLKKNALRSIKRKAGKIMFIF